MHRTGNKALRKRRKHQLDRNESWWQMYTE